MSERQLATKEDEAALARKQVQGLAHFIRAKQRQVEEVAQKHFDFDRVLRLTLSAASRNGRLLKCTPQSVLGALMDCARWQLEPTGRGGVWLVPFWNKHIEAFEAVAITDYRGELALVRRTGQLLSISAHCVYENDDFRVQYGDDEFIEHSPPPMFAERGKLLGVYAIAKLKTGELQRRILSLEEIERTRDRAPGGRQRPWSTDFESMATKTAIRRLCNLLPMPSEYQERVAQEEAAEGPVVEVVAHTAEEAPARNGESEMARRLKASITQVPEAEAVVGASGEPSPDVSEDPAGPRPANPPEGEPGQPAEEPSPEEDPPPTVEDPKEVNAWPGPDPKIAYLQPVWSLQVGVAEAIGPERGEKHWNANCPALTSIKDGRAAGATMSKAGTTLKKAQLSQMVGDLVLDINELGGSATVNGLPETWTVGVLEERLGYLTDRLEELKGK